MNLVKYLAGAILTIVLLTIGASMIFGAWGPLGCPAVAGPAQSTLGWYPSIRSPGQWAFWDGKDYTVYYRASDRAMSWRLKDGAWSPYVSGQMVEDYFGQAKEPEGTEGVSYTGPLPTGVDWNKLDLCPAGYFFNGDEIDRQTALALAADGVPENLTKPWLVAIGDESFLAVADQVFSKVPAAGTCRQQLYLPHDWAVERFELSANQEFAKTGKAVLLMLPGDANSEQRVVHLQYDLNDGAEGLAKVFAAFDPTKVPDLRAPGPKWPEWVPAWARNWQTLALVAAGLFLLISQSPKKDS